MFTTSLSAETTDGEEGRDVTAVRLSFTVRNDGSEPVTLRFRTGQRAEFTAHVADGGDPVWRHAEGRAFTQVLGSETLEPGESATYEGTWSDPPAGTYRVVGELAAERHEATAETTLSIPRA